MSATRDNVKRLLEWTKQHNDDLESFEPIWLSSSQIKEVLYCIDVVGRLENFLMRNDINEPNVSDEHYKPMTNGEKFRQIFGNEAYESLMRNTNARACAGFTCDILTSCSECGFDGFWDKAYQEVI